MNAPAVNGNEMLSGHQTYQHIVTEVTKSTQNKNLLEYLFKRL